jgi:hypothetical protein
MTDFRFDVDLDESLFSLDLPAGYIVQQAAKLDLSKKPLDFLAEALKLAAEANDGVFPPELRGEDGIDGIMMRAAKTWAAKPGVTLEEARQRGIDLSMSLGGAFGFLGALTPETDWHYAGKDVKLNAPDTPIFWYKRHPASTTYEILYADLSIREVPADEAPTAATSSGGQEP